MVSSPLDSVILLCIVLLILGLTRIVGFDKDRFFVYSAP